jgi:hypothetical protein
MNFRIPHTYWFFNAQIIPAKKKCHACVTDDEQFFLINTANRKNYDCVPILAEHYPFLRGQDRFISCSRLFKYAAPNAIEDNRCPLRREDVEAIITKVKSSYILEQENIEKIILSLSAWLADNK